ncbi:hypothetical protein [Candidatus Magnetaquicoccus inordinatus]|uniref:hypothetical protein n=1 Tax=Candidatus Magnetaquicoccus inordinatus TaxID=2496818 RepID=UPI00102B0469|nr:hypothetical protein [Candidatus Magnetaquicoccus inordinatus]
MSARRIVRGARVMQDNTTRKPVAIGRLVKAIESLSKRVSQTEVANRTNIDNLRSDLQQKIHSLSNRISQAEVANSTNIDNLRSELQQKIHSISEQVSKLDKKNLEMHNELRAEIDVTVSSLRSDIFKENREMFNELRADMEYEVRLNRNFGTMAMPEIRPSGVNPSSRTFTAPFDDDRLARRRGTRYRDSYDDG